MENSGLRESSFDGAILTRGFWLYIWEISLSDGRTIHYVGKTGDKASGVCQSPFDRFSKHLGFNSNNNALRKHLSDIGIDPEHCRFRFHAHGPLFTDSTKTHGELCDIVSSLEAALASEMQAAGYAVINVVNCRIPTDASRFSLIRSAFATH